MAVQKCPICKKVYDDRTKLSLHVETKHSENIPKEWSGLKFIFYEKHGRVNGTCMVCKGKTEFNESTGKPNRLCQNPNCVRVMRENAVANMKKRYGKETLLNDPEFQKKMLDNRKISKDYKWSDGVHTKRVVGSYEYDGMEKLDLFFNMDPEDVIVPAPMIIPYEYEGTPRFYIPDAYISSLNLIIEFKDGGDNPNTHPKIQAVDKQKEKAKEDAIKKIGKYNYVKVENKQYGSLLDALIKLKNSEEENKIKFTPVIITNEMTEMLCENLTEREKIDIDILVFYEKDMPMVNEIGLRVNDKIYVNRSEYMTTEEVTDVIVVDHFKFIDTEYRYKEKIAKTVPQIMDSELPQYVTPVNFPLYLLYEVFLIQDGDEILDITIDDVYNVFSISDYEKFHFLKKIEKIHECKELDALLDEVYSNALELELLPDEILSELKYEIPGIPLKIKSDDDLKKLDILIENNIFDTNYKTEQDTLLAYPVDEIEYKINEICDNVSNNRISTSVKKLILYSNTSNDLLISKFELDKITSDKDKELLKSMLQLKESLVKDIDTLDNSNLLLEAIDNNDLDKLNALSEKQDIEFVNNTLQLYDKAGINKHGLVYVEQD